MILPISLNRPNTLTPKQLDTVNSAAAHAVAALVRTHLRKLPGKSFYKQAADSTSVSSHNNAHCVPISKKGIALQFFGGTVRPTGRISPVTGRPTRALLIPLIPKTQFHNLSSAAFILTSRSGSLLLVSKQHPAHTLTPIALLRKSATIKPHPHILPSHSQIKSTAAKAAAAALAHILSN